MSQLKKGAILSYVNIGLTNTIGLILTPFIISSLGNSEYGLYTLIGSIIAYFSLMDLGLNNTIVRFVAKYKTVKDEEGERKFLGTIFLIYFFISLVIVLLGVIMYYNLDNMFSKSLTAEEMEKAKIMFQILIFNMALVLPGGAFTAICNAYESFVWPRMISIIKYVVRAILVLSLLTLGGKSITLVIIDTGLNIVFFTITFFFVTRKLKVKFNFRNLDTALLKTIFKYSVWIFLLGITSQFLWNAGQIILGAETDTKTVAFYAVGIMLGGYYGAFSSAISGVFLPRATQMSLKSSKDEILAMMIRIGRISLIVLLFIFSGFLVFGKEFILLWVGEKYMSSYYIAAIIMAVYTIPLILNFANSLIEAYNKVRYKVLIYLLFFSLGLVLGYYLIPQYKEIGMIIGVSSGWMVSQIVLILFYHRKMELNMITFFTKTFNRILIPVILLTIITFFANTYLPKTLIVLIAKIAVYASIYWSIMYFYGMNASEKSLISRRK